MGVGLRGDAHVLLEGLQAARIVGILRAADDEAAVHAAIASVQGGLQALEIAFTTPNAAQVIAALRQRFPDSVLLGAGTVMNPKDAQAALEAGAEFLVSPHFSKSVLEVALETGIPYLPGVLTPTEVVSALELGVHAVKLFPIGSSGGVSYLQDLLGPLPSLRAFVTGGINPPDAPGYLRQGALAVGLGSKLFPVTAVRNLDGAVITSATQLALREALP
ncbi:MAG: bifunctional 4-hydroxy-2-oxoglutarate aldolase/2-dehydro-3-deoxy-phosphogluconate aldolase [Pleurocapsa sp. SU_196_0]|nr:bifunctional 4-hydroxy-2-oxoglutarate aldolase/2-dehydro-3-deoxy-phosphogluconate aldolase [Pleurocapsa sp. SU_196_0]